MIPVVKVSYPYVYDLYYRTRNGLLENEIYAIDFLDWVKAGVAYNILGVKNPGRKIAYFADLYTLILDNKFSEKRFTFQTAVMNFYEDLFQLYQDHLVAQMKLMAGKGRPNTTAPGNLILLPSFEKILALATILPVIPVELEKYECKNTDAFRQRMATIYAEEGTTLYRGMALMFDYGVCREGSGPLLGVSDFGYSIGGNRISGSN